jgi:hypothetical protein
MYKTRIYRIWDKVNQRCRNKNQTSYKDYGGRGITICDEWRNDFMSFYNWAIVNGYEDSLSIDRINNDGNYEPSNCRFSTQTVQSRNTRRLYSDNTSGYRGVHKNGKRWRASVAINRKSIHLGYFDNPIDAAKARDSYIIDNKLEHTLNF